MKSVISMGVPEREAILAATANPARSIGIYDEVGSLTPGKRADIVLTDEELNIVKYCRDYRNTGKVWKI